MWSDRGPSCSLWGLSDRQWTLDIHCLRALGLTSPSSGSPWEETAPPSSPHSNVPSSRRPLLSSCPASGILSLLLLFSYTYPFPTYHKIYFSFFFHCLFIRFFLQDCTLLEDSNGLATGSSSAQGLARSRCPAVFVE